MSLNLPESIGKFQVLQPIGEGGMGRLYLGRDPDIGRLVAIKLLREGYDNKELRERFSREAKSASALRHANIVTIFETGMHQGMPYIAMEYIQGGTLGDVIAQGKPLSLQRKLELMEELCDGMQYAHRKHVIHRDIKPANIMIDEEGVLRILDFGIARLGAGSGVTLSGTVMGTPNYMSPEQWAGQAVDERTDIFASGAVFYELLSYQRAFPGTDIVALMRWIVTADPKPLKDLCSDLDPEIVAVVNRCLARDPGDRYQNFGAVREAVAAARRRLASGAEPKGPEVTTPEGAVDWDDLPRIRRQEIQRHVDTARRAFESGNYTSALRACQQALMLDPEQAEAKQLVDKARAAMEQERLMRQWLTQAKTDLDRGAVTAASQLVEKALSFSPESSEALALRKAVDETRRRLAEERARARALADALARANQALEAESFETALSSIDEAFGIDPANEEARELKQRVIAARAAHEAAEAARRKAEAEAQAARAAIEQARERFAGGDYAAALEMLERFQPKPLVVETLEELRAELQEIERLKAEAERKRREEEERKRIEEAQRKAAEAERRRAEEAERKRREEERLAAEAERRRAEEAEAVRQRAQEAERARAAEERKRSEEAQRRAAEAERRRAEEAERRGREEAERKRREADRAAARTIMPDVSAPSDKTIVVQPPSDKTILVQRPDVVAPLSDKTIVVPRPPVGIVAPPVDKTIVIQPPRKVEPVVESPPRTEKRPFPAVMAAIAAVVVIGVGVGVWRWIGTAGTEGGPPATIPVVDVQPPPTTIAPKSDVIPPGLPTGGASPEDTAAKQLTSLRTAAREAWARGEREPALNNIAAALKLEANDAETSALVQDFVRQARDRSAKAAAAARDAKAQNNPTYMSAQAREGEGARLMRAAQSAQAVRAYSDAADLFTKAATESKAEAVRPPQTIPPQATIPPPTNPPPTAPPATSPPPTVPSIVTPPTVPPTTLPQRPPETLVVGNEEPAIRDTLQRYRAGYESLNPNAVKAVFPTINAGTLATVFKEYVSLKYEIEIDRVQIAQDGRTATVTGVVTSAPVVRVGRASAQRRNAVFALRKTGASWIIENVKIG